MSFNPGFLIASTTAAVTHNQRVNKNKNENETNLSYEKTKFMTIYDPVTSSKEILKELKLILEQENNNDEYSISIYDLVTLIREKYRKCKFLDDELRYSIRRLADLDTLFLDVDYDCKNRQLIISYHCDKMFLTKQNDDLILVKSEYFDAMDILGKCGDEISKIYDTFIKDISFYDYINYIKSVNSNFIIDSDKYKINIKYNDFFEISALIYKDEYDYDCNSNNITSVWRNNEDKILKKIFVKIDDCPEWTHEILYEIRKKQVKKQKRLQLIQNLNPFKKIHR